MHAPCSVREARSKCPSIAVNAVLGVAMFLFNVLLTLYLVWATFTDDMSAAAFEEVGVNEVLQVRAEPLRSTPLRLSCGSFDWLRGLFRSLQAL